MDAIKRKTLIGFAWKFFQNAFTQIISFIMSVVLARILMPEDYGLVAMITVFTTIAMVFINTGFSSAIIQRKKLSQIDTDTVFYTGLVTSIIIYIVIFYLAPFVAKFYRETKLISLLRVESIIIIIASTYSVPQAIVSRELEYKKSFIIGLTGALFQGIVGIVFALNGFGVWSLILGTVSNNLACAAVTWAVVKWRPRIQFSKASFWSIFAFSNKMLAAALLDTIFNNIRSIVIGRRYTSADLAYYNRGYQFPALLMNQVDGAMTAVLFSSLSKYQDDWDNGLRVLRRSMKTSMYICTPLLIGLMAVAEPFIVLLLTEKWIFSVEYVRLTSAICMFWPLSARRHALNARGYSAVSLRLNIIGKLIILLCMAMTYTYSIRMLIIGTMVGSFVALIIEGFAYSKYLNYKYMDQLLDIIPTLVLSTVMGIVVYMENRIPVNNICKLCIQIPTGISAYVILSILTKNETYNYLLKMAERNILKYVR